jgi:hypothetical protein
MTSRDVYEVRKRIEAERTRLGEHLTALEGELRSAVPFLVAGLVTAAALTAAFFMARRGRRKPRSVTITWRLW